jgi:diguanylate cyclase (GGDEF)-like protein
MGWLPIFEQSNLPKHWQADFEREWVFTSYQRARTVAGFLLAYSFLIPLLLVLSNFINSNTVMLVIDGVFFGIAVSSILVLSGGRLTKIEDVLPKHATLVKLQTITFFIMVDITFFSIWLRTGFNAPYLIGIYVFMSFFYYPSRLNLLLYVVNFIFYLLVVTIITQPFDNQFMAYLSGSLATITSMVIAYTFFRARVQDFLDKRTIAEQTGLLQQANAQLLRLATLDGLTQIPNRRRFNDYLSEVMLQPSNLAVVMCDVDHFKRYNDHYGHQMGDECLKQVAATLEQTLQQRWPAAQGLAARYGGEEFVLVLLDIELHQAQAEAEAFRQAIAALDIPHQRSEHGRITLSLGVAWQQTASNGQSYSIPALLRAADEALYAAKSAGRNQVMLYQEPKP